MEQQALGDFGGQALGGVPEAGDPAHLEPVGRLRLHDRARAEGVAAVQRERVVEDVEDPEHRRKPCHDKLNGASTASA